jgi:hypothetical protein
MLHISPTHPSWSDSCKNELLGEEKATVDVAAGFAVVSILLYVTNLLPDKSVFTEGPQWKGVSTVEICEISGSHDGEYEV